MKSRSFDGFQSQKRQPVVEVHGRADLPLDVQRGPTQVLVRTNRRIDIGLPVERVEARRSVVKVSGNLRVLPIGWTKGRATPATTCVFPFMR
jgi:hypothetical protein